MVSELQKQTDKLELFRKRTEILSSAKLRETDRINSAIKVQDTVRSKIGKWDGARVIRKWRSKS